MFLSGLFIFSSFVLLSLVTISTPIWNTFSFLNVHTPEGKLQFGVFGFTGSARKVGYNIPTELFGVDMTSIQNRVNVASNILVLHPIIAGMLCLALIIQLANGLTCSRRASYTIVFIEALFIILSMLAALVLEIVDWYLFVTLYSHFRDSDANASATFGDALWMTVGAFVSLLLSICAMIHDNSYRRRFRREIDRDVKEGGQYQQI